MTPPTDVFFSLSAVSRPRDVDAAAAAVDFSMPLLLHQYGHHHHYHYHHLHDSLSALLEASHHVSPFWMMQISQTV